MLGTQEWTNSYKVFVFIELTFIRERCIYT